MTGEIMIDKILNRLNKVKTTGSGKYKACCPAHNDSNPSLVITDTNEKILVKCWAGCSTEEILNAMDLTWSDLFHNSLDPDERLHRKQKQEIAEFKDALTILEIAKNTRKAGEKLSNDDLQLEREAWRKVNG